MNLSRPLRLGIIALTAVAFCAQPGVAGAKTIVVKRHHSIQAAIDKAKPGDKIVVQRGTYNEALVITTNRLTLSGRSAVLKPPTSRPTTPCSELDPSGVTGICVAGSVTLGPSGPTPGSPVERVLEGGSRE